MTLWEWTISDQPGGDGKAVPLDGIDEWEVSFPDGTSVILEPDLATGAGHFREVSFGSGAPVEAPSFDV